MSYAKLDSILNERENLNAILEAQKDQLNKLTLKHTESNEREVSAQEYNATSERTSVDTTSLFAHRITTQITKSQNGNKYIVRTQSTYEFTGQVSSEYDKIDRRILKNLGIRFMPKDDDPRFNLKCVLLYNNGAANMTRLNIPLLVFIGIAVVSVIAAGSMWVAHIANKFSFGNALAGSLSSGVGVLILLIFVIVWFAAPFNDYVSYDPLAINIMAGIAVSAFTVGTLIAGVHGIVKK